MQEKNRKIFLRTEQGCLQGFARSFACRDYTVIKSDCVLFSTGTFFQRDYDDIFIAIFGFFNTVASSKEK